MRKWVLGLFAVAFGLATLVEGGHVIFGGPAARAEVGHYVPFVLYFNFSAAFVYVLTGLATIRERRFALLLARALAGATALVFIAFGVHVAMGGAFERRTVAAMTLRTVFWAVQAFFLARVSSNPVLRERSSDA